MKLVPARLVRQSLLGVLLLGLCFVLATPAVAQNQYFVNASTGNDANDGSQARPWRTLAHASSAATIGSAGAVVHVADGSYTGPFRFTRSGTSNSARLTFTCDNQSNATRRWPCLLTDSSLIQIDGSYVTFQGFDYTTSSSNVTYVVIVFGNFVNVQNNRIHDTPSVCTDNGGAGIAYGSGSSSGGQVRGGVITGNWIFNISSNPGGWGNRCHGIYIEASNMTVMNNVIYNNKEGYGIKYDPGYAGNPNNFGIISNNTLWGNGGSNFCPNGPTPCNSSSSAGGCMIFGASRDGANNPTNLTVNNNICYQNPGSFQGINFYPNDSIGAGSVLKNNVMFGNGTNAISGLASGTIFSAPNFTNFKADGSGDYTPTSSTPLKGGGSATCSSGVTTACVPTVDFAGVARLGTLDIGAFAQGSSTASSAPSAPTGLTASVQ